MKRTSRRTKNVDASNYNIFAGHFLEAHETRQDFEYINSSSDHEFYPVSIQKAHPWKSKLRSCGNIVFAHTYQKPHPTVVMRSEALLAFTSLTILFGTTLAAPKGPTDFSHPEPEEPSGVTISTGDGSSGGKGQGSCPNQTYDPSGLFCSGNSGSSIPSLPMNPPWLALFPFFLS